MPETTVEAKPIIKSSTPVDGELSSQISQSITKQTTNAEPPKLEENKTEKETASTLQKLPDDLNIENKTEKTLLEEKNKKIREQFEELLENMSPKDKAVLMEYLNSAEDLGEIFEEDEKNKVIDSLAELTRLIAILAALISMLIFNPQDKYSGKDLGLSDDPPDLKVNDNEEAAKMLYGDKGDKKQSWNNFRKSVDNLKDLSFGQFMNAVLIANDKNSVRGVNVKENKNSRSKKLLKKLALKNMKKQSTKVRRPITSPK